jgi:hypothetical protein
LDPPDKSLGTANRDLAVIDDMIKLNPQLSVHVSKTSALEVDRTPPVSQGPAAAMLGLNRTTLMFRMRKLGIERPFRHVASAGSFMTVCVIWITARNVNAANGPAPNACQPLG